jgi:hypothetical protein
MHSTVTIMYIMLGYFARISIVLNDCINVRHGSTTSVTALRHKCQVTITMLGFLFLLFLLFFFFFTVPQSVNAIILFT